MGLTGCATVFGRYPVVATAAQVLQEPRRVCFVSKDGLSVENADAWCPSPDVVNAEVRRLLERVGAPDHGVSHARVVLTRAWLECAGEPAIGCTRGDVAVIRMIGDYPRGQIVGSRRADVGELRPGPMPAVDDWRVTLAHELGHVLRARAGLGADAEHADAEWWKAVEARRHETLLLDPEDPRVAAMRDIPAFEIAHAH